MEDAKTVKPRRRRRLLSPSARGRKGGRVGGKKGKADGVIKGFATLTPEERTERARQAGRASGEARRRKKLEQQPKEGNDVQS